MFVRQFLINLGSMVGSIFDKQWFSSVPWPSQETPDSRGSFVAGIIHALHLGDHPSAIVSLRAETYIFSFFIFPLTSRGANESTIVLFRFNWCCIRRSSFAPFCVNFGPKSDQKTSKSVPWRPQEAQRPSARKPKGKCVPRRGNTRVAFVS